MDDEQTAKSASVIRLDRLGSPDFGLTPNVGGAMAEAASVCLDSEGHGVQEALHQVGDFEDQDVEVVRLEITAEMLRSHRDEIKATYEGAEGIAILLLLEFGAVEQFERATKAGRDEPGGGFDYWFVEEAVPDSLFLSDRAGRLEVSGIRKGEDSLIRRRLDEKVDQTKVSDEALGDRKTLVVVVEFGRPQTWVRIR